MAFNSTSVSLTLKHSYIIQATCLPVRNRFSLCATSSAMQTLLLRSPLMIFLRRHAIFLVQEPRSSSATERFDGLQFRSRLRGPNLDNPNQLLLSGDLHLKNLHFLQRNRQIRKFPKSRPCLELKFLLPFFLQAECFTTCSSERTVEVDKLAVTHCCRRTGAHTHGTNWWLVQYGKRSPTARIDCSWWSIHRRHNLVVCGELTL